MNKSFNILIIDNYDSFTYNLYQLIGEILTDANQPFKLSVHRNNQLTLSKIKKSNYSHIIISPGPGDPSDQTYFGVCADVLLKIKHTPILGVCLGMQGIAHYFGGRVIKAPLPMHGKTSKLLHNSQGLFKNLPQNLEVMRYHSLIADPESLPDCLEITATAQQSSEIMGLRHKSLPIQGIQFHPESFATPAGKHMLKNFLYNHLQS